MDTFSYRDAELFAEGVALSRIAERFGTPTYVYSRAHIEAQYRAYADALRMSAETSTGLFNPCTVSMKGMCDSPWRKR